jgi:hypothetical protein
VEQVELAKPEGSACGVKPRYGGINQANMGSLPVENGKKDPNRFWEIPVHIYTNVR